LGRPTRPVCASLVCDKLVRSLESAIDVKNYRGPSRRRCGMFIVPAVQQNLARICESLAFTDAGWFFGAANL
jgi:hypothetical protein